MDALGRHDRTPLQLAALDDNPYMTTALLATGARANFRLSANNSTALELAAKSTEEAPVSSRVAARAG